MSTALTLGLNHQLAALEYSLESYLHTVRSIPVLNAGEERVLAEHWQQAQDLESARQLVLSHLRFVVYVAQGYQGYGLPLADLIQEGNVGLMKAVKRFDPAQGVRLVSFAVHWIRAEIHEFILRNWRIVKVATTKAQRKLFFNLRSMKKRMGWLSHEEVNNVARDLGVSTKDVLEMEKRMSARDVAFDAPTEAEDEDAAFAPSAYLEDSRYDPARMAEEDDWEEQTHNRLHDAFTTLDPRSQDILQQRWMHDEKATLHELAAKYKVSAERIRQIETAALKKLRKHMES